MFKNVMLLGLFAVLVLIPLVSNSEAKLWDLQVQANVENSPIISGERPIVSGVVTDHASNPVYKATVNVKSQSMSIFTTTSQSGEFSVELGKHERIPGNYIVTVSVSTLDGKTGMTTTQFQVKGELSPTTVTNAKLSTPQAQKYLNSNPEDFAKNPIGLMLYNYYQKLYQEYLEEQQISNQITQEQQYQKQQQDIAKGLRIQAIEEFKPKPGILFRSTI